MNRKAVKVISLALGSELTIFEKLTFNYGKWALKKQESIPLSGIPNMVKSTK